ncbi:adhesion G-protein coupled receptor G1-like isoform X2 [Gymnodraco acuticeps]|uniref:Adhesion G-protein coupled receptor G1-like isoform X2 n=1 Tax=Gymnodraco acuticeps TaxID=8218 RepID=A0A6P8VCC8_GYMAC|nr:adhesion G-protein coupled receptor G1-like isoform X2 [Gymnodraco acuticeps]
MRIPLCLLTLVWFPSIQAGEDCRHVLGRCLSKEMWTRCYESEITSCSVKRRSLNFIHLMVNSSQEAEESPTPQHTVHIPSTCLQRISGDASQKEVLLVATVINSTLFKLSPPRIGRRRVILEKPIIKQVLGGLVLAVRAGNQSVRNLSQPVRLTFRHNRQVESGTCVFWQESHFNDGTGVWSTDGCETSETGSEYICSCNHLSFFAVLVNPALSVQSKRSAVILSNITYIGSALSIFFTIISLIIYICLQRQRPEKAIGVHLQLSVALLCLHLSFLLGSFWVWQLKEGEEGWVCGGLGLFLHWSLLATVCWMALEGFHLYLLLVRVFNIYVRRYLLKLSLVGWGIPTLIAGVCGISGVYGKYTLKIIDATNPNTTSQICWMSSQFPQMPLVSYVTTMAFPCLVILCNFCMLGLVVFKLWRLRAGGGSSGWKKMHREKGIRLWKDCATVLGLSCVLGLPWGLAGTTYISLSGIYLFTILNSLQGLFMFLWSVALTCKPRTDDNSSSKDPSSQKVMTTSFNN